MQGHRAAPAASRLRDAFVVFLWTLACADAALFLQLAVGRFAYGRGAFENAVGAWIEASLLVPASVGAGLLAGTTVALTRRRTSHPPLRLHAWLPPVAASGALYWAVLTHWQGTAPERHERPDVIVLMLDTLRRDYVDPRRTPHLVALSKRSHVFEDAVSASSWTRPAVASMFTGLDPEQHRATSREAMRDDVPTIAERFREAGYETTAIVSNPQLAEHTGLARGFDYHAHLLTWDFAYLLSTTMIYDSDTAPAELERRRASLYARFVRDPARPWFLFLHFMDPHSPRRPPTRYREREQREFPGRSELEIAYGADVRYMDAEVGRFLEELARLGRLEQSIVAVVSDHGEELEERRMWSDGVSHNGHGHSMLPEVIHVPLFVKLAGSSEAARCGGTVSTARLGATLLEVAGLSRANDFGVPLLDREGRCTRDFPMTYQSGVLFGPLQSASRDGERTVIVNHQSEAWQSFDRVRDPTHVRPEPTIPEARRTDLVDHLGRYGVTIGDPNAAARPVTAEEVDPKLRDQLRALGYLE